MTRKRVEQRKMSEEEQASTAALKLTDSLAGWPNGWKARDFFLEAAEIGNAMEMDASSFSTLRVCMVKTE